MERLPVEKALEGVTRDFKAVSLSLRKTRAH
jgi:predicted TIM-barrel enzyme